MSVQNSFLLKYTKRSPLVNKQECPVCKKQFSLPAILTKHLKNHHGLVQPENPDVSKNVKKSNIISKRKTRQVKTETNKIREGDESENQNDNDQSVEMEELKELNTSLEKEVQTNGMEEQTEVEPGLSGAGDGLHSRRRQSRSTKKSEEVKNNSLSKKGKLADKELPETGSQKISKKKIFDRKNTANTEKEVNREITSDTSTVKSKKTNAKVKEEKLETKERGRKRQIKGDETESDSQTDNGERRPKRNRKEKRAWSPSNDNSIILEATIKEEPIDFEEEVQKLAEVELSKNFTCEICDKSFSTRAGLSRHLRVHQDIESVESPVKLESTVTSELQEQITVLEELKEENIKEENEEDNEEFFKTPKKRGRAKGNKTYPCTSCLKVFTKPSHLLRHQVKHTGERPFPCDICGKGFVSKSNMEKHRVLHSGQKTKICDECGKAFALSSYLVRHKMLHEKERNERNGIKEEPEYHLCSECGKVFSKALYLRKHQERHIKGKCYECRICGKKFSQRMNRINHEFLHTKTKNYECHICNKKFALKCYLKVHTQRHIKKANNPELRRKRKAKVSDRDVTEIEVKPFKCNQCGKGYTSAKYLAAHEKVHQNPKKFVCETCGRKFHQKINLQRHLLTHTDPATSRNHECKECGKKYSRDIYLDRHIKENHTPEGLAKPRHHCQYCEKSFIKPCLLRIHERTHTKEKPFVCSTCGKGFAQEGYMKIHEEIHSEFKKHECTFCGKSFALLYYLTRHLARHEQAKTIGCDQCSKMFATQKALFDHQRMHTGDLPYKCDLCEKSFPRANSLQRHKKLNACQNKPITQVYYRKPSTSSQDQFIEKQEVSCLYICSVCRQVFTSQAKLDAHVIEHEQETAIIQQEEEIAQEAIPVTKEEETIIAEVVNVEESLLGGEEITTEETVVDAEWLNKLFENAHVESGTDGKIIIVVNRE